MEEKGLNRSNSIAAILIFVMLLLLSLFWLLGQELYITMHDLPLVLKRFSRLTTDVKLWIQHSFSINSTNLENWLNQLTADIGREITNSLGGFKHYFIYNYNSIHHTCLRSSLSISPGHICPLSDLHFRCGE